MFSTFTTDHGNLIIRAVDIRRLEDLLTGGCILAWDEAGEPHTQKIEGTAQENMDRLKQEETDVLIASENVRQRQSQGYPGAPIKRGAQSMRMVKR